MAIATAVPEGAVDLGCGEGAAAGDGEELDGTDGAGAELDLLGRAVEEELAVKLRAGDPPVIAVVRDGRTLLDCRTLTDDEAEEVAEAVRRCR